MQQQLTSSLLLTLPEAAARLRISRSSLYRLFDRGEIKSVRVGARRLVSLRTLEAYIERLEDESNDETG